MGDILLTKKQVAEALEVSEMTINRWMSEGRMPGIFHIGKRGVRFSRVEVERHVAQIVKEECEARVAEDLRKARFYRMQQAGGRAK